MQNFQKNWIEQQECCVKSNIQDLVADLNAYTQQQQMCQDDNKYSKLSNPQYKMEYYDSNDSTQVTEDEDIFFNNNNNFGDNIIEDVDIFFGNNNDNNQIIEQQQSCFKSDFCNEQNNEVTDNSLKYSEIQFDEIRKKKFLIDECEIIESIYPSEKNDTEQNNNNQLNINSFQCLMQQSQFNNTNQNQSINKVTKKIRKSKKN